MADALGLTRANVSNHLSCLPGCGLVAAQPEGRRVRYELADRKFARALGDLLDLVLVVDPAACAASMPRVLLMATEWAASGLPLAVSCDACCADEAVVGSPIVSTDRRLSLNRRVRLLVAATISYNVIEAIVAITAGTIASSTALIGFGLDSVVEVSSAAIVAWQFSARDPETRERTALRVIAWRLRARRLCVRRVVARPVRIGRGRALHGWHRLASVSLLVMPFLSYAQRRTGRELGSRTAVADSKQTLLCTYLSAVRTSPQQSVRMVVGRSDRRTGHRRHRTQGGP